jgi:hypothetical protein
MWIEMVHHLGHRMAGRDLEVVLNVESQAIDRLIPTRACKKGDIHVERTELRLSTQAKDRGGGCRIGVATQRVI